MTIETKKVANANEAIEIINRLNYRHDTFCYEQTTREDNADIKYRHFCSYRANGEKDGFAMLEIVVNGKLEAVRFYNLFRDITVELRLGNFTPNYGRYNEIINVDETTAEDNVEVEDSTKTTTTNAATENKITVESARANGLSMEEFFAANAGLTVEEYRAREEEKARKAEETAKAYALQAKIDTCKSTINFYDEKSRHAAWYLYNAVIKGDEDQATYIANDIAEFENKIAEAKKELADLEPATEAAEDSVEATAETDGSEEDDDESFTANVMPAEDDDTEDELIDPPDPQTVERNKGNYKITINGEHVTFRNFSIDEIDANDKLNCSYTRDFFTNRRTFYYGRRRTSAAKIIERYMLGEIAAEQSKAISDFFFAHKLEVGNPFKVCFEITTADGTERFFSRTFDTFAEAKALADEFTSTFSEPSIICIKQNKQCGKEYFWHTPDGCETFTDAYCKMNSAAEDKAEEKNFTANCYYTYTKDDGEWNGSQSKNFATATEAANWIINLVRDNGYTLTDGNIRDWNTHKRYFLTETDFNAVNAQTKVTAAEVEPNTEDVIATIDPEIIYKAVKTVGGEVRRTISRGFEKGGKEMWFSFGRRISKTRAAELLAECGFRSIDEFIAAEKVAEQYKDEVLWPRWDTNRQQAKFLRNKILAEVKPCDDNAEVFNLLPDVNTLNDVEDEINADDAAADSVEAESAPDNTKTPNEVYRPFTVEAETVNVHGQTFSFINIYGERVTFVNGEVHIISSDKYNAHFNRQTGKYVAAVVVDGNFKPITFNTAEEFFAEMVKRGACTIDEQKTTPEPTPDDFSAKLAELKAECDAKQVALIKAQDEHKQASEALQNCLSNIAVALKQKLNQLPLDYTITLKKVSGSTYRVVDFSEIYIGAYHIGCDVEFHFENWKGKTIARYDTPEQVETVINMLKAAIERGDKEFTFPTVDELNQPSKDDLRDSLKRAAEIAQQKYHEYERDNDEDGMLSEIELYSICTDAIKELEVA